VKTRTSLILLVLRSEPTPPKQNRLRRLEALLRGVACALAVLALGLAGQANAASYYFTDAGGPNPWDTTTANWASAPGGSYDSVWPGGDAHFEGTAGTVNVDAGGVGSVNSITFDVTNYILSVGTITMTGAGINSTVAGASTQTINSPLAGTAGLSTAGGGTSAGATTLNLGGANSFTGGNITVGSTSAYNTLNVAGGGKLLTTGGNYLNIGAGAFGNNKVEISTPGTSGSPSFTAHSLEIGTSIANNSLVISNGAYYKLNNAGNTSQWMGRNLGGNNNSMIITGTGSTMDQTDASGHAIQVGGAGDGNYIKVEAGGVLKPRRIIMGATGGDNNYVLITGLGSQYDGQNYNQAVFQVGASAGAVGNSFRVENQATGNVGANNNQTGRPFSIGYGDGSNNNYVLVAGTGSALTLTHTQPVAIGGDITNNTITDSVATGNHLDVSSGGALTIAATTSLYVTGVDSAFNLGDGNGISTATVGTNGGAFSPGVYLKSADGRLNFDSGRLTAGVDGALVSGAGQVNLLGPAIVDTSTYTNSIDSVIAGGSSGTLTKEGAGTLTLSAANTYSGDTKVNAGTLKLTTAGNNNIANSPKIIVGGGAILDVSTVTGPGGFQVVSGQTLGGSGAINGAVTINTGGTLAPGASIGTLTMNSNLTFANGGNKWVVELLGAAADHVDVTGTLTLGDATALEFVFNAANPFKAGTYTLASYGTLSGTFSSASLGAYSTGVVYGPGAITIQVLTGLLAGDASLDRNTNALDYVVVSNHYNIGSKWAEGDVNGDGAVNALDYVTISNNYGSHVPEPATLALLGLGGLGLLLRRKRR